MRGKLPLMIAIAAGVTTAVYTFKPIFEQERRERLDHASEDTRLRNQLHSVNGQRLQMAAAADVATGSSAAAGRG
ncbi:hypothetical protein DFH27DRAFT_569659 [Peziza echinospora]|nr:hypothetical protein DFH27DRAFT_569659 [Peziza echinospora]